jgi:hypothetical protein
MEIPLIYCVSIGFGGDDTIDLLEWRMLNAKALSINQHYLVWAKTTRKLGEDIGEGNLLLIRATPAGNISGNIPKRDQCGTSSLLLAELKKCYTGIGTLKMDWKEVQARALSTLQMTRRSTGE